MRVFGESWLSLEQVENGLGARRPAGSHPWEEGGAFIHWRLVQGCSWLCAHSSLSNTLVWWFYTRLKPVAGAKWPLEGLMLKVAFLLALPAFRCPKGAGALIQDVSYCVIGITTNVRMSSFWTGCVRLLNPTAAVGWELGWRSWCRSCFPQSVVWTNRTYCQTLPLYVAFWAAELLVKLWRKLSTWLVTKHE